MQTKTTFIQKLKQLIIGRSYNLHDKTIFHKLSLIAFFAWVGLGADGLSSSCYGPEEAYLALNGHVYLSIFVAIAAVFTIFIISASYSQIIELFPSGGGGYLVASKLLSPAFGMFSGCALLIDYVLTITVSISSGADAIFSLLPGDWQSFRLMFTICVLMIMMLLNMRGVKESIIPLVPVFLIFLITHIFIIIHAITTHLPNFPQLSGAIIKDTHNTISTVGFWGMIFLVLRAYSMGAGTYTGIEAVSNGIPVLREPKVRTAKATMRYMAFSLSFVVLGLMVSYLLYGVKFTPGKTLNAVLFQQATLSWGNMGYLFILITLFSEAMLLFVAAQTGFIDGPRVLANMAVDRWFPARFSALSDRFVTRNGILIMTILSFIMLLISRGSVRFLVVLYSINVFITFVLSQFGMVRHWWISRFAVGGWYKKLFINGTGFLLSAFILISMVVLKFHEGGWITLLITGLLVAVAIFIKRHYYHTAKLLHRLNNLVVVAESETREDKQRQVLVKDKPDLKSKTAVLLVNGFNGVGLHTLFSVIRLFSDTFKNFVFIEVGILDAGNFKGAQELDHLQCQIKDDLGRYVKFVNKEGFYAEGISVVGVDVIEEVSKAAPGVLERFPNVVFFGGQLVFPNDSFMARLLHNYTVFALQKKLYRQGIPCLILPIRV